MAGGRRIVPRLRTDRGSPIISLNRTEALIRPRRCNPLDVETKRIPPPGANNS